MGQGKRLRQKHLFHVWHFESFCEVGCCSVESGDSQWINFMPPAYKHVLQLWTTRVMLLGFLQSWSFVFLFTVWKYWQFSKRSLNLSPLQTMLLPFSYVSWTTGKCEFDYILGWVFFPLWISFFKNEDCNNYRTAEHLPLLPIILSMCYFFLLMWCKMMYRVWVLRQYRSLHLCKKEREMNIYSCLRNETDQFKSFFLVT